MKIEFVPTTPRKHLGELNSGTFFCKGCGIVPDSPDCPICRNLVARERRVSWLDRLFPDRYFSTQAIVGAIVAIFIFVFVYNAWK